MLNEKYYKLCLRETKKAIRILNKLKKLRYNPVSKYNMIMIELKQDKEYYEKQIKHLRGKE